MPFFFPAFSAARSRRFRAFAAFALSFCWRRGVAALGADVLAGLLALPALSAAVRVICAARVAVVIVGVAGRLGRRLAV